VNCGTSPATLTYNLDKKFDRLAAVVGLADFAPADLAARFLFAADGRSSRRSRSTSRTGHC